MYKFKTGDFVKLATGHRAKILTAGTTYYGYNTYLVEFVQKDMIPPQMEVEEKYLEMDCENNPETNCPVCKKPWKITMFNAIKWYDCEHCNKPKEEIMKNEPKQ